MEKIQFKDLPSMETPLSSANLNQMQDNMEDAIIPIKLVTISDTAPGSATTGDMYYNTTDNKIYTATADNTWDSGSTPRYDGFYINTNDNTLFYYNGTKLIHVGLDESDLPSVKNEETNSETDVYSCNYINNVENNLTIKILWENTSKTSMANGTVINLSSSDYDMLLWVYSTSVGGLQNNSLSGCMKGNNCILYSSTVASNIQIRRQLSYVTDTRYTASSGYANSGEDNNNAIPLYCIGIKLF